MDIHSTTEKGITLYTDDYNYIGNFDGQDLWYDNERYEVNNRRAFFLLDEYDNLFAVVSTNLQYEEIPDYITDKDSMIFVNPDLTSELVHFLRKKHIISEPYETVNYNMEQYELCRLFV